MVTAITIHLMAALLLPQDSEQVGDPVDMGSFSEGSFDVPPEGWFDNYDAEVVSTLGIRPGVPHSGQDIGGGNATVTFPHPVTITINPPRVGFPIPGYSTAPRTVRVPAGLRYTGPDRNKNKIHDDLESSALDISN